jgi:hypothetical protein
VTDRRSVLRTFFDVTNPRKVGCEPLCGHRSRATAVRTPDGVGARDGDGDERYMAQLPLRTDFFETRSSFRGRSRSTADRTGGDAHPSVRESKKGFHTGSSSRPLSSGPSGFAGWR